MGFLAFLCLLVVGQLALPQALIFVWLAAAGFLAVFLYRRSTGQRLSVMNGARLGWISGIFGFVIVTIILTLFVIALSEPSVVTALREQIKTRGIPGGESRSDDPGAAQPLGHHQCCWDCSFCYSPYCPLSAARSAPSFWTATDCRFTIATPVKIIAIAKHSSRPKRFAEEEPSQARPRPAD